MGETYVGLRTASLICNERRLYTSTPIMKLPLITETLQTDSAAAISDQNYQKQSMGYEALYLKLFEAAAVLRQHRYRDLQEMAGRATAPRVQNRRAMNG